MLYDALSMSLMPTSTKNLLSIIGNSVTAFHIAAEQGHEALVRCMVEELGADVNLAMRDGLTPLMAASFGKHKMVAKVLNQARRRPAGLFI
jgi:ankyrin repeat protein